MSNSNNWTDLDYFINELSENETADRKILSDMNDKLLHDGIIFPGGKKKDKILPAKPCKISTIVSGGPVNSFINLQLLYRLMKTDPKILFVEYGKVKTESDSKGTDPNDKPKKDKRFDNQMTIVIKVKGLDINVKIFRNGSINMTGVKYIHHGPIAIQRVIDAIKRVNDMYIPNITPEQMEVYDTQLALFKKKQLVPITPIETPDNAKGRRRKKIVDPTSLESRKKVFETYFYESPILLSRPDEMSVKGYKIGSIKCDFMLNCEIRRDRLYNFISNNTEICASYETHYSAIRIRYFFNDANDGICRCTVPCRDYTIIDERGNQRKIKNKNKNCTQVTICIFDSGSANLAGAKTIKQVIQAYDFITKLVWENKNIYNFEKIVLPTEEELERMNMNVSNS
jgi:hypothetical protein